MNPIVQFLITGLGIKLQESKTYEGINIVREYKKNKRPITSEPPHKNTNNLDTLTMRRLPIYRNLLLDAPAATRQSTPSHIWHLINIHRADRE